SSRSASSLRFARVSESRRRDSAHRRADESVFVAVLLDRDDAHHRSSKVTVGILDPAPGTGSDWLVVAIEVSMESAVVDERAHFFETQDERAGLAPVAVRARKQLIRTL